MLDHPAADKAVFGQAVRARSAEGGGWLGWVVAVEDLAEVETRIGRQAIEGHRHLPDGTLLEWRQLGVRGLQSDPQLPFFVQWRSDAAIHPSVGGGRVDLLAVEIAGSQNRVDDWLGGSAAHGARRHPDRVGGPARPAGPDRGDLRYAERGRPDLGPRSSRTLARCVATMSPWHLHRLRSRR